MKHLQTRDTDALTLVIIKKITKLNVVICVGAVHGQVLTGVGHRAPPLIISAGASVYVST